MSDSSIGITTGTDAQVDTRTVENGDHRQVVAIGDPATGANVAAVSASGAVKVDGSTVTQPVSGTVTVSNPTANPETGLAKDATLTDGTQKTQIVDAGGAAVDITSDGALVVSPAESTWRTGNITSSSTTLGPWSCADYTTALLTVRGTYAGVNLTVQVSDDGTNWFGVVVARRDSLTAPATTTGVITSNASISYLVDLTGWTQIRVRSTAYTSGTAVVGLTLSSAPASAVQTYSTNSTMSVSGTATTTPATPTPSAVNSAASTNATAVKTSAGTLYSITASNTNAAVRYLKLYNKASAPTVGTDVPVLTIPIPAGSVVTVPFGSQGYRFATGIALAITAAAADTDTTAVAASEVKVLSSYI